MRNGSGPVVYTTINVQCQCTFVIVIICMKILIDICPRVLYYNSKICVYAQLAEEVIHSIIAIYN